MTHPMIPSGQVLLLTVLLCLCISCNPVVCTITAGLPVASFAGAFDILQLYCTGAISATKSTTSVSFVSSLVPTSSGNSIYSAFAANGYAAMLGPVGTMLLLDMYSGTAMSSGKMVAFAPLVQDFDTTSHNEFTTNANVPQVYFTLPRDTVEVAALMLFFSKMEQLASFGTNLWFGDTDFGISQTGWPYFYTAARSFGASASGYYFASYSDSLYVSQIQSPKTCFILYAAPTNNPSWASTMQQFMSRTFTDSVQVERNTTVVLTFAAGYLGWSQYRNAGSTKLLPSNVITVAPVPGMDSTDYAVSQAFAELREANFASVTGNNDLNYVMTGWMSGMTLIQALTMLSTNNFNSNGAMENFLNNIGAAQSNFLVYDMVTGPLGTTCPTMAITQGVSCCQTGGRNAFLFQMKQMSGSYDWSLMDEVYTYPSGVCANILANSWSISSSQLMPAPYHVFGQAPTDNDMMTYMCGQVQAVTRAMANTTLYGLVSDHPYRMYCQTTTMSSAATDLTNFEEYFQVKGFSGAVADALVGLKTTGFTLDFIPQTTQPALTASNLFYLFPTLEQELYQMAVYLYTLATPPTKVCGVIQTSTSSTAIKTLLTNTLSTFSLPFSASNVVVLTSGTLAGSIPAGCTDTFIIGLDDGDVAALVSYLQEQSSSSVYISFDDLTKYYDQFQSQSSLHKVSGLTSRLVFATNLPSWTATPSASSSATMSGLTTYEEFLQSVDTSLHTPAALRTFFVVSMFGVMTAGSSPSLPNLQTKMYTKSVVSVGGLTFGPYLSSGATLSGGSSSTTAKNYGAQEIGVWSYSRVVDPMTPLLMQPSTPSLVHTFSGATAVSALTEGDAMVIPESRGYCIDYAGESSSTPDETTLHSSSSTLVSSRSSSSLSSPTTATPTVGESSDGSETKSNPETLDILMLVLGIVCAIVWTVVLLVWLWPSVCGAVSRWKWFSRNPLSEIDSVCGREQSKEVKLRLKSHDATRAPSAGSSATLVVVDMPGVWQRWSCTPEAMRRDHVRYYRIVRQAIVEHVCYEVRAVSGTLMIACPSARVAIALVGCVAKHCVDAGLTRIRMAVLTASCASSVYVGGRGWWCGDEVAHTILSMCGLAAVGQILVSKSTLSGLNDAEVAATGAVPYEGLSLKADVPVELYDLPLLTGPSEPDHPLLARRSTALMIASVERGQSCHVEKTVKVVKDVMYFHYQIVGADVRCMDVMRLCGGFAPGEEATTTDDRCLTLCGDKVAAVLAWTHSDPFVLPKSHDVPMLSQLLTDGQSSSFVAQRLTDGHVSIPVGGIDVCPSIDTQRHSRGSSARHRLRQRSGTLLHFAYDDARASGDHEDEVS